MCIKIFLLAALAVSTTRAGLLASPGISAHGLALGPAHGLALGPAHGLALGPALGPALTHAVPAFSAYAAPALAAPAVVKAAPSVDYVAYPKYEFKYGVADGHTGDQKTQSEIRDGDVVKGSYSLVEADGTLRTVTYTADDHNGFNAVVTRAGHAVHPATPIAVAPKVLAAPAVAHAAPAYSYAAAPIGLAGHGFGLGLLKG